MKKSLFAAIAVGAILMVNAPAEARDGCGPGAHRGPAGFCRPNGPGPVIVGPGPVVVGPAVRVGVFYPGHGYWDGNRYWAHRTWWHHGWRYRH
ncbi:GCG_CRPN prefix-to-repeats domain-containing protein [Novosphingobium sp.]|uniref:GCG_CRPN prefix-to-repeats domain-containing protein n=1 Tax=Novosphingobium sp. TaxID=1874826 RepID=UPI003D0DB64C